MRNKKTPMFESAMPSAYDFVDFTSPEQESSLSKFGRDLKGNEIINESLDSSDKAFSNLLNQQNEPTINQTQKTDFNVEKEFKF